PFGQPDGGGLLDRDAIPGRLDQAYRELRLPTNTPRLAERARRAAPLLEYTPRHAERGELVQQVRPATTVRRAQVELDELGRVGERQPRRLAAPFEVASERHLGGAVGHRPDR